MDRETNFLLYDELSREERLAIKSRLADLAVDLVMTYPNGVSEQAVIQEMRKGERGEAAGFGVQLAVEQQRLERDFSESPPVLRIPEEPTQPN